MKSPLQTIQNWKIKLAFIVCGSLFFWVLNWHFTLLKYAPVVATETMQKKELRLQILCSGIIVYKDAQELKAEIAESIAKKYVQEGMQVKAGDILLELSSIRQKLSLDKETYRARDTKIEFMRAEKEWLVQKELYQKQAVSLLSVEKAQQDFEKAKTNLSLVLQEFEIEKRNFGKTKIVSPINGTILVDNVQNLSAVEQGRVLFVVGQPGQFQMDGKIDELNIQNVALGAGAEIVVDAFANQHLKGVVSKINAQAETGAFSRLGVKIDILDAQGLELKSNLNAQAYISAKDSLQAIWLPVQAIKTEGENQFVFVVNKKGKLKKTQVSIGKTVYNFVEVAQGLSAQDVVVTTAVDFLSDGQKVKIK